MALSPTPRRIVSPARRAHLRHLSERPEGRELIEAKSRVERGHVREALAQLLDYARYVPDRVDRLAALFPRALGAEGTQPAAPLRHQHHPTDRPGRLRSPPGS
ncbi:hypothetical protein FCI23_09060 [Actinacidiphila oryziradicis]|uniref:Uncharacterized protein n=1 Tax=Actinacidiphila oryziradicis TaxID=2571141 RepID=A0A4U0SRK1_9ACTN|nr:hypothetical protein FCI23_09060 [Actinacidiphila oryziradicis]